MKNYIVVAEVPKLKIPYNSSIKITDFKKNYFLYPYEIIKTLNKINQNVKNYRNGKEDKAEHHLHFTDILDVDKEDITLLVTEIDIDIEEQGDEILEVVKDQFKFLLNLFSFIFRELFFIKTIYIFQKKLTFYEFIRMIKIPIFHKETSNDTQLIQAVFRRDVENLFPILLLRLKKNDKYLPFIEEYLTSRTRTRNIIIQYMISWNNLEHLTNIFWEIKGETKLFESRKVAQINKIIKSAKEDDIAFPYISLEEVNDKIFFNNIPPILTKIRIMCKKIHLTLTEEEFITIKKAHYIRNRLFHKVYDISKINDKFRRKFNLPDFQTKGYGYIIRKFLMVLEKILLRLFQFTPRCLKIYEPSQYFHNLKWKKMGIYSKKEEKDIYDFIFNSRNNIDSLEINHKNHIINQFLEVKQKIFFRGKYISLLKLLNHLNERISFLLKRSIIIGYVDTKFHNKNRILLQFKENLKGIYYVKRKEDHLAVGYVQPSTTFISTPNENYNGYQIEFELIKTQESSRHHLKKEQIKINGEFFTLLIDIKKI